MSEPRTSVYAAERLPGTPSETDRRRKPFVQPTVQDLGGLTLVTLVGSVGGEG